MVGAGNAAGLFPEITPAPTPSAVPAGTNPVAEHSASPGGQALDVFSSASATPTLGLIALVVAFLVAMTRLSVRRRKKKDASRLSPEITPSPTLTPSPGPEGVNPAAERSVSPAGPPDVPAGAPARPALGLIALAAASLLVMTRLFVRRRTNRRGPDAQR